MNEFATAELTRMQATQDAAMQDTCIVMAYSGGAEDDYGMPLPAVYTAGETLACGLNTNPRREAMTGAQVAMVDARLRVPIDTVLDVRDRLRITHRFGVAITDETYEILGVPRRGPSGLLVDLKRVTDGSA
jgi:hypothetical protein